MSQNKRYHKKSHLSPRPASKFFFYFLPLAYFVHSIIIKDGLMPDLLYFRCFGYVASKLGPWVNF